MKNLLLILNLVTVNLFSSLPLDNPNIYRNDDNQSEHEELVGSPDLILMNEDSRGFPNSQAEPDSESANSANLLSDSESQRSGRSSVTQHVSDTPQSSIPNSQAESDSEDSYDNHVTTNGDRRASTPSLYSTSE